MFISLKTMIQKNDDVVTDFHSHSLLTYVEYKNTWIETIFFYPRHEIRQSSLLES